MVIILNSGGTNGDPLPWLHDGAVGVDNETEEANHGHGQSDDGQDESGKHKLANGYVGHVSGTKIIPECSTVPS